MPATLNFDVLYRRVEKSPQWGSYRAVRLWPPLPIPLLNHLGAHLLADLQDTMLHCRKTPKQIVITLFAGSQRRQFGWSGSGS
jgi:hypothetical protein